MVHPTGKTHRAAAGDIGIPSAWSRSPLLAERAAASGMAYLPGALAHQSLTSPSFWKSLQLPDFELLRSISAAASPAPLLFVDLRRSVTDPFSRFCLTSLCTTRPVDNQFLKPGSSGSYMPMSLVPFSFLGLCTCSSLLSAQPPPSLSSSGSCHCCSKLQILSRHLSHNTLVLTVFTPLLRSVSSPSLPGTCHFLEANDCVCHSVTVWYLTCIRCLVNIRGKRGKA